MVFNFWNNLKAPVCPAITMPPCPDVDNWPRPRYKLLGKLHDAKEIWLSQIIVILSRTREGFTIQPTMRKEVHGISQTKLWPRAMI